MLEILAITGPIYVLIAIGYLAVRSGLISQDAVKAMGTFVLYFALPSLLFLTVTSRPIRETFDAFYIATYTAGSLSLLIVAYVLLRRYWRQNPAAAAVDTMGMVCPNSGFIGYPVMLLVFPAMAGPVLAMNMLVENFLIIPLLLMLASLQEGAGGSPLTVFGRAILNTLRMPLVISLLAGLAVSLSGFQMPEFVTQPLRMMANASAALSLFVIGGSLYGVVVTGLGQRLVRIVAGKLLLHPLFMFGSFLAVAGFTDFEPGREILSALIITASLSMMGIYPVLGQRFGQGHVSAVAMIIATAGGFFTLSALLYWLGLVS